MDIFVVSVRFISSGHCQCACRLMCVNAHCVWCVYAVCVRARDIFRKWTYLRLLSFLQRGCSHFVGGCVHTCACVRGEIFRKWTCLELFPLLQSALCTLCFRGGEIFRRWTCSQLFPLLQLLSFSYSECVFVCVCVHVHVSVISQVMFICLYFLSSPNVICTLFSVLELLQLKIWKVRWKKFSHVHCCHCVDEILSLIDFHPGLSV